MSDVPWYISDFGEDYLRVTTPYLYPERTQQEVIGIFRRLQLPLGAVIMDLCCGHGRHSIPLAALGYRVIGFDLSKVMLDHALAAASESGIGVRWVRGDMRRLPFAGMFDAVINVFNSFGYLEDEAENLAALDSVYHVLKPGGLFLLETIGRDGLLRNLCPSEISRHADGTQVQYTQSFDHLARRLETKVSLVEPSGAIRSYGQSVSIYTLVELSNMFSSVGLKLEGYWGGLDGRPFGTDSPRLVILARKP